MDSRGRDPPGEMAAMIECDQVRVSMKRAAVGFIIIILSLVDAHARFTPMPFAGEMTLLHRTGELRFDTPISLPLSAMPAAVAVVDLDRDGAGDRFHDLVVFTNEGLHLLENRPVDGFLGLDANTAERIADLDGPDEGWSRASITTLSDGDKPPFIVAFADGVVRLYQVADGFQGSGAASNLEPLRDRDPIDSIVGGGTALDLETTLYSDSNTPAVVAFGENRTRVLAIRSRECDDRLLCIGPGEDPSFSIIADASVWNSPNVTGAIFQHDPLKIVAGNRWCAPDNTNCDITSGLRVYGLTDDCPPNAIGCDQSGNTLGFQIEETYDFEQFDGLVPLDVAKIDFRNTIFENSVAAIGRVPVNQAAITIANRTPTGPGGFSPIATVASPAVLRRRLITVADLGALPDGTSDGREDVLAVVPISDRVAELHAFRDRPLPRPASPTMTPSSPPVVITTESGELNIVDMAVGHFNSDDALDVVLVDAGGSRLIIVPGRPLPEATFITVSTHGHRGGCSAAGELGVELPGCAPDGFPVEHVQELDDFSQALQAEIDSINLQRRLNELPSTGSSPALPPVGFIGVNGHWEDSTTDGAAAQIGGRALWIASMQVPAPTCFENMAALMLLAQGPEVANMFFFGPDFRPKEYGDAVAFMFIPSLYPITSTMPDCIIPIPNRGALARFLMAGAATLVEGWGVSRGAIGSAAASADLAAAIDFAVARARMDTQQCGQVLVDVIGHSRGTTVMSEALRLLTTTELGYNARVSMTLLDAIDASFLPASGDSCGNGDSCRPWAKAGFLTGDPAVEAVGNVDLSSGFASLPSQALPLQPAVEITGFIALGMPLGGVASHVVGLPIGHDREDFLVDEMPSLANRPSPLRRVFGGAVPPTTHDDFQNHFWVGTGGRGVLDRLEAGFLPVNQLTMRNVSALGLMLGDDARATIPDSDGWFRTLDEDASGELGRTPAECGGPGPLLTVELESDLVISPAGQHLQREFVADHDFNQSRGLVRIARELEDYADVVKSSVPDDLHMFIDAFLDPAERGTFPPTGAWQPKQSQDCAATPELPAVTRGSLVTVLGQMNDSIRQALGSNALPRRAAQELRRAQERTLALNTDTGQQETTRTVSRIVDDLARAQRSCRRCEEPNRVALRRLQTAAARLLEITTRESGRTETTNAPGASPCLLANGEDEMPFQDVLYERMVSEQMGAAPTLPELPAGCDEACLSSAQTGAAEDMGQFAGAWSDAMGELGSNEFSDRTQYIQRIMSGGTHTGESFASFLEQDAVLSQRLAPASMLADRLFVEVDYRFRTPDGRLAVELEGHGLAGREERLAAGNDFDSRQRIVMRVTREKQNGLTPDALTISGRSVDVFRASVRHHEPLVSKINGRLYDLVLVEGGVDWAHANAVATRTVRNSRKGVLASLHDERVLAELVRRFEIDVPVWLGAQGGASSPQDFKWSDGTKFDFAPWAEDVEFSTGLGGRSYVYLDPGKREPSFRHSEQMTSIDGRPFAFLIDYGAAGRR